MVAGHSGFLTGDLGLSRVILKIRLQHLFMKKNHLIATLIVAVFSIGTGISQDWAKARLEKSPRHLEWVKVKQSDRQINCSIAFPETKDKAAAVLVIHEIFGLTDW